MSLRPLAYLWILPLLTHAQLASAQTAPTANAGPDAVVECAGPDGTDVVLDGTGSSDPDMGDVLSFVWTGAALPPGGVEGAMPTVTLPGGVHVLTLTVTDSTARSDTDDVTVQIADTTPPELVVGGDPVQLWPPNHRYHRVGVERFVVSVEDACEGDLGAGAARFEEVVSDEPENSTGDGNTVEDIVLTDACRAADVRSERRGPGDGRVYEAVIVAEDASGNEASERIGIAEVAHDQGRRGAAVDSGDEFAVSGECESPLELCPPAPALECNAAEGRGFSRLRLHDHPRSDDGDRLAWLLAGFDSTRAEFGDPTLDTDYELCVWVEDAETVDLVTSAEARAGSRWRATRSGFKYRVSGQERGDGVDGILLHAADSARGRLLVSGRGSALGVPDLPIPDGAVVHTQLHNSIGECWGASFDDPRVNNERTYSATGR